MMRLLFLFAAGLAVSLLPLSASAVPLGSDAGACEANQPAVLATITGLKDRTGTIRLELYPAAQADFTRDERQLAAEGKTFRRVSVVPPPAGGPVSLCIRVPGPGRYAVLFIHDRDGKAKFNYRVDGAGVPTNRRIGFAAPKVDKAIVSVGETTLPVAIRVQYLGLLGFSPSSAK